ncbi:small secreted protein [Streptomyces bambusae]|uniref:small secreted protein n=1 Tax=Streptomyces bambusae TaxID=1550616 RepID=UPI001CFC9369|nr:small secreted protein [Streptomyces bambusae]MCB5166058.1 small secreted protein [Streptomyces bambusae]
MNKKLAAAVSGGAVLVLVLSGCGDDSDKKVNDWAKKVCDQVQPQVKKIEDANTAIQKETTDQSKADVVQKTDSAAFQAMSQAYASMGTAVQDAGVPPVKDGEKTRSDAVAELNSISKSYATLKTKVDGLDSKDQAKFADGLKEIAAELDKLGKSGNEALTKLQSGELGKAMKNQKSCQRPEAGASAPAQG